MPKIIRILRSCSMKIFCKFPTVNISKLNFWLVICIAKNFIWTTFTQYLDFFAPSDSRFSNSCISAKYCPIITNHTSMESFQIMYKSKFKKIDPYDWFCGPGSHLLINDVCSTKLYWRYIEVYLVVFVYRWGSHCTDFHSPTVLWKSLTNAWNCIVSCRVKCVLTRNDIGDDLQPIREQDTVQGRSPRPATQHTSIHPLFFLHHFLCVWLWNAVGRAERLCNVWRSVV